ncbi:MAG: MipA/OmpV family protein [Pseudomonadota bacterium]
MQRKLIVPAGALMLSTCLGAFAQVKNETGAPAWGIGLGAVARTSIYAGESSSFMPVPLLSYEGENFFWRGIGGGFHVLNQGGFKLDATVGARLNGVKKDDFGVAQLAAKGINRNLLADRHDGLDVGIAGSFKGQTGAVELALKGDVAGASRGLETSAKFSYPLHWRSTLVAPNIAVHHYSNELANYYYGTRDEEVARGVVNYKPGSTSILRIGVDVMRPFADQWVFIGNLSYSALPGEITNSPLVDKDTKGVTSVFIGVSRRF